MIYLPRVSWMDYLPAVYRNADSKSAFLERYLALFQTLYEDLNRQIGSSALLFDPCAGPADFLRWTASWFGERDLSIWPEEKLRRFLPQAVELYRRRGTARSILDLLELYTGERPFLVENAKLKRFRGAGEFHSIYAPLYGENSWEFTVLIREKYLRSPGERGALLKLIEEMKPAQTSVRLVALRPCIFAGQYSYLGVNSVLSRYKPLAIDGSSQFSMTAIGGGDSRPQ
jgi:phage tail-like protein